MNRGAHGTCISTLSAASPKQKAEVVLKLEEINQTTFGLSPARSILNTMPELNVA